MYLAYDIQEKYMGEMRYNLYSVCRWIEDYIRTNKFKYDTEFKSYLFPKLKWSLLKMWGVTKLLNNPCFFYVFNVFKAFFVSSEP